MHPGATATGRTRPGWPADMGSGVRSRIVRVRPVTSWSGSPAGSPGPPVCTTSSKGRSATHRVRWDSSGAGRKLGASREWPYVSWRPARPGTSVARVDLLSLRRSPAGGGGALASRRPPGAGPDPVRRVWDSVSRLVAAEDERNRVGAAARTHRYHPPSAPTLTRHPVVLSRGDDNIGRERNEPGGIAGGPSVRRCGANRKTQMAAWTPGSRPRGGRPAGRQPLAPSAGVASRRSAGGGAGRRSSQ